MSFKPAYEQKQISSFRIKGGSSQTVAVEVNPAKDATSGSFPVVVPIASGEKKSGREADRRPHGDLQAGRRNAHRSSLARGPDRQTVDHLRLREEHRVGGQQADRFSSFKPENWKVEFKPEKIEALEPNAMKQVEVTITPAAQALVGDYSVGISVDGEKGSSKTVEFRCR